MARGRGEEVTLDQSEVNDSEENCKVQAYTRVTILRMEGKQIFHNTDHNSKSKYTGVKLDNGLV